MDEFDTSLTVDTYLDAASILAASRLRHAMEAPHPVWLSDVSVSERILTAGEVLGDNSSHKGTGDHNGVLEHDEE